MRTTRETAPRWGTPARVALGAVIALLGVLFLAPPAHPEPVFTDWVRHPSVAAQPASGQNIKDLAVKNGEVFLGYGDYGNNTGPVDIAAADLQTGVTSVKATANTEEINTYRTYDGALYAPWIDTKGVSGFYTSDAGGFWHDANTVDTEHVFDVAVLPNGVQVAVGSANNDARTSYLGATAWVSRDGGATWRVEMNDLTNAQHPNATGYERYYWVAVINGKAYMQARAINSSYGVAEFPIRVFDGVRWSTVNKSADCFETEGHAVEVFNGKAYCGNGVVFTGKRATFNGGVRASDFYQHAGDLYALGQDGTISRLANGSWVRIATAPSGSRSLAVTDTHLYVGGSDGWIRRAAR